MTFDSQRRRLRQKHAEKDMEWVVIGVALLAIFSFLGRQPRANLYAAMMAIQQEGLTPADPPSEMERIWSIKPRAYLVNSVVKVGYIVSEFPDSVVESLDMILAGYQGGVNITFRDGAIVGWKQNGVEIQLDFLSEGRRTLAKNLLHEIQRRANQPEVLN